jgi:hypothetical protein
MGYFVATKDLNEHNELLENGKSIDHLKVWGKDLSVDNYIIGNDGSVAFKGTPYAVTYKACLESGNFFFVPMESDEVEGPIAKPSFGTPVERMELTSDDGTSYKIEGNLTTLEYNGELAIGTVLIEEPKRRGPKRKNI